MRSMVDGPILQPPDADTTLYNLCTPPEPPEMCLFAEKGPREEPAFDVHASVLFNGDGWLVPDDELDRQIPSTALTPRSSDSMPVRKATCSDELGTLSGTRHMANSPLNESINEYDDIIEIRDGPVEFPHVGLSDLDNSMGMPETQHVSLHPGDPQDRERLAEHYNGHLIEFLSVKTTAWNFYSYVFQTVQTGPDSALKYGVLAWAESHRSWSRRLGSVCPGSQYIKADAYLKQLHQELTALPTDLMFGCNFRDKLNSLLATSLFLSHCDVMYGDHESLFGRLSGLKRYLTPRWQALLEIATGVQLRVLIWLAYLDLRATLWTAPAPSSQSTDCHTLDKVDGLFDLLRGSRTDDSLRQLKDSKYYLVECFGSKYPEQELRDDLSEEPWKLLSDDAMILFCDIKGLYAWCHQFVSAQKDYSIYEELRQAKIRAIRSDIARIRAECNQIHSEELQAGRGLDYTTRVRSHFLRCTCLHLSATILLNRITSPNVRTDPESQEAAREIIQITQQLKKAGDLQFPRSVAWPLPLFLAGIEVEDEVYQDWVLNFMEGLAEWGGSVMKATALLRRIVDKQAIEGVRISPWHTMMELGETIIV
ncbi:hypothetical protein JDV02_005683 [Purpureocillium takamizusanense]|uniref:Uncharacterized protein n=1 Tax=Purpureocillium takamizusanense TaxID=2060973 RepID=A0A9Q8QIJ8_9HYPO|nr:uncharacterized protein JDV02_005683 [Purpureocillium takamizusanense]UNI19501.1 hypothetical protein JDV02_005683 [Purpureocillium takamizusanense]